MPDGSGLSIISDPASGMQRVRNIYLNPTTGRLVIEYEQRRPGDIAVISYPLPSELEDVYATRIRYAEIGAGLIGNIAGEVPEGGEILTGGGGAFGGLPGIVSALSDDEPDWEPVYSAEGELVVVASLQGNGNYTLSADPGGPCALVFACHEPLVISDLGSVVETMLVPLEGVPSRPSAGNYRVVNLFVDADLSRLTVEYDDIPSE